MFILRSTLKIIKFNLLKPLPLTSQVSNLKFSSKTEEDDEKPIKYSLSPASKWKAEQTRTGNKAPRLWYEPYVVIASISALLIYFCVLREENDLDIDLQKSIYARIDGLEEHQLRILLDYNKRHGLETEQVIKRLNELESLHETN